MIYSPAARSLKIGRPPCMTTCPLRSASLHTATEEVLYKHFALFSQSIFTAYKIAANIFSCSSSISAELKIEVSNASPSAGEPTGFLCWITFDWSLEVICDPFALLHRCPQSFVSDAITVKVVCSSTCAHCVL